MLDSFKMVEKQSEAFDTFLWHFFKVSKIILFHIILLKYPHVQIAFLKFTIHHLFKMFTKIMFKLAIYVAVCFIYEK